MIRWVLAAQVGSTLFMMGLIWFVQIVHYPLFAAVGSKGFAAYERQHSALTTLVVGPVMLVELSTAVVLALQGAPRTPHVIWWVGLALLGVIWCSTFFLQVPRHGELAGGFVVAAHTALVRSNWLRTAAWSARSILVLWVVFREN